MTRRPRLIIADDHAMFADGLRHTLRPEFQLVGVAATGDALLKLLEATTPDCVLLDLSLPGRCGLDVLPELRRKYPLLPVVVVTMYADHAIASAVIAAGAQGFVPKDSGVDELKVAIREALANRQYVSPKIAPHAQHLALAAAHPGFCLLTARQQEIVLLIARGLTSEEIARQLGVSAATIAFHRLNIRKRLGVKSDSGLLRYSVLIAAAMRNSCGAQGADPPLSLATPAGFGASGTPGSDDGEHADRGLEHVDR